MEFKQEPRLMPDCEDAGNTCNSCLKPSDDKMAILRFLQDQKSSRNPLV